MIKNFTLFGERHSGTNVVQSTIQKNSGIKLTWDFGFKHWFILNVEPRPPLNTTTDIGVPLNIHEDSDKTLVLFVIRSPFTWIPAMFKKPHHMYKIKKDNLLNFVQDKVISLEPGNNDQSWRDWVTNEDGYYFIEEAKNIIDLRNQKNEHFYNLRNIVKNFEIIRYESFNEDLQRVLVKYNLLKGNYNPTNYTPKNYPMSKDVTEFIINNLNNEIDEIYYGINRKIA